MRTWVILQSNVEAKSEAALARFPRVQICVWGAPLGAVPRGEGGRWRGEQGRGRPVKGITEQGTGGAMQPPHGEWPQGTGMSIH